MFLAYVTHDLTNNTLEATWLEANETGMTPVKRRNYSQEQKTEFLTDTGPDGQKYVDMAGWQ